jgi:dihydroorotase
MDGVGDIFIRGESIVSVGKNIKPSKDAMVVDCSRLVICPAFCDAHVHLRTPGQQRKENIVTGCHAAARGGVTTMLTMPNTMPPIDSLRRVASILSRYKSEGFLEIHIAGAISKGQRGKHDADWEGMLKAGAVAFTDDGKWTADDSLMRDALEFSRGRDIPILSHAEDASLHIGGCVNLGIISRSLNVPGIPVESEVEAIRRDIELAKKTGGRLHIQHVSTADGVELIKQAKKKGVRVTCETTPHHLLLNEEVVPKLKGLAKMNPPLRTESDRRALIKGVKDGTIDMIATDHAPHTKREKRKSISMAPFGVTGLETMFSAVYGELVLGGGISLSGLIELISHKPRSIFGFEGISLRAGCRADLVIIDPERRWVVREKDFKSRGKNSPFIGREFTGKVLCTIHRGEVVFKDNAFIAI